MVPAACMFATSVYERVIWNYDSGHLVITREHWMDLDEDIETVACPLRFGCVTLHLHTTELPPGTTSYSVATS